MFNLVAMKFEGEKPKIPEYVVITGNNSVRKWNPNEDMSNVIGYRIPDNHTIKDDEIFVCINNVIDNRLINDEMNGIWVDDLRRIDELNSIKKNPLFTSKVDSRGRLTIRSDVRQRKGIKPGDSVDVFEIEKLVK